MLSIQNKLRTLYTALAGIESLQGRVYHDDAVSRAKFPYLVWYEESEDESLEADNHKQEQSVMGYVNLYTKTEFDPIVDEVQEVLNGIENLSWSWDARTPYDPSFDDNDVQTYSWTWRMR